jgi:uncharacterized protein
MTLPFRSKNAAFFEAWCAMYLKELWRYPVKSMAGESLQAATLTLLGIEGDRIVQVRNARGRPVTARTHPGLLGFKATLDEFGRPLVDGVPWDDPTVLNAVRNVAGKESRLVRDENGHRFDVLPLLIATDGAIAEFGRDGRRLRPNLVIGGVSELAERKWEGGVIRIGEVVIAIRDLRARCVMTTFDPDSLAHDPSVLRDIVERFDGKLALNCEALRGGKIRLNQEVQIDLP